MQLLTTVDELKAACEGGVCMTLGVFDAVHRGHRMLIDRACEEARARGLRSLVFTFKRHPLALLAPAYCPPTVTQPERKARIIESLGVDCCLMLEFTREVAAVPAEEFIERILVGHCRARFLVCGNNFTFGAGGKGNVALLKEAGERFGFDVEVCHPIHEGSSPVSSTRTRQSLVEGRVAEAARLLDRRYGFGAKVVPGDERGRQLGFPTANLEPSVDQLIPADGVYAVVVSANGRRYGAMLNVGERPTFEEAGRAMEAHLFDFSGELLGETVDVEFVDRVRDEKKFGSVDELVEQLKRDEKTCRDLCGPVLK